MHHRFHFHTSRSHGKRGLARFGRGYTEGDIAGRRAFGMGRKLASVDLQLLILSRLADKPSHGYEIIKALDEDSNSFYIPSPAMVYPALTYLEEIGHATIEADGARKRYHITDAGNEHLAKNGEAAAALSAQLKRVGERMDRVRRTMGAQETDEEGGARGHRGPKELVLARRELKMALAGKAGAAPEELNRIVDILNQATAEISGK